MAFVHISPDMTAGDLVVGVGTALLAIATAWLASRTSHSVKASEEQVRATRGIIEAQETERRHSRREDAAIAFNKAMRDVGREVPGTVTTRLMAYPKIQAAIGVLHEEWDIARAYLQQQPAIDRAVRILDSVLFLAESDCTSLDSAAEQNFFPLSAAFEDLHDALGAFVNGDDALPPRLPEPNELLQLAYPDGEELGLEGIRRYLAEHSLT